MLQIIRFLGICLAKYHDPQNICRKIAEKKITIPPKNKNIKTMFTKILSRQEANDNVEIDSD